MAIDSTKYLYQNSLDPNNFVYSDLNVRLPYVSPQDATVITDREAILQSLYRLIRTEEGEIPFYRSYGLNLKQFLQRPLGESLAKEVSSYVTDKISNFEPRVEIHQVNVTTDYNTNSVLLQYYLKIKSTEEIIKLETISVPIG